MENDDKTEYSPTTTSGNVAVSGTGMATETKQSASSEQTPTVQSGDQAIAPPASELAAEQPATSATVTSPTESSSIAPSPVSVPPTGPADTSPSSAAIPPAPAHSRPVGRLLYVILAFLLLAAGLYGGFLWGTHRTKPASQSSSMTQTVASLKVPQGATIIEQCVPNLGAQYVLPKDIPTGPVYNVYQNKVIGIEYMAALSALAKPNAAINNLKLFNIKYDHINVMTMPAHVGFPEVHYQMDVMLVPTTVTDMITCAGNSSSNSMMMPSKPM